MLYKLLIISVSLPCLSHASSRTSTFKTLDLMSGISELVGVGALTVSRKLQDAAAMRDVNRVYEANKELLDINARLVPQGQQLQQHKRLSACTTKWLRTAYRHKQLKCQQQENAMALAAQQLHDTRNILNHTQQRNRALSQGNERLTYEQQGMTEQLQQATEQIVQLRQTAERNTKLTQGAAGLIGTAIVVSALCSGKTTRNPKKKLSEEEPLLL
jgi:hypothetical protein